LSVKIYETCGFEEAGFRNWCGSSGVEDDWRLRDRDFAAEEHLIGLFALALPRASIDRL